MMMMMKLMMMMTMKICYYDPDCGSELWAIADNVRKYVDSSVRLAHLPNTQYVPILHIYHFYTLAHLEA